MTCHRILLCVILLLGWHAVAAAQETIEEAISSAAKPQAIADEEAPVELEPLTVTGARSRLVVQREMYDAQDQAFRMFNELNTDDGYDMICRRERPRGAQFMHRVCKARFHREMESRAADEFLDRLEAGVDVYHVSRREIDQGYDRQQELMVKLATSHPEYRELLEKHFALRQEFEEKGGKVRYLVNSE